MRRVLAVIATLLFAVVLTLLVGITLYRALIGEQVLRLILSKAGIETVKFSVIDINLSALELGELEICKGSCIRAASAKVNFNFETLKIGRVLNVQLADFRIFFNSKDAQNPPSTSSMILPKNVALPFDKIDFIEPDGVVTLQDGEYQLAGAITQIERRIKGDLKISTNRDSWTFSTEISDSKSSDSQYSVSVNSKSLSISNDLSLDNFESQFELGNAQSGELFIRGGFAIKRFVKVLELSKIKGSFSVKWNYGTPIVALSKLSADVLGGSISVTKFNFDKSAKSYSIPLRIDGIQVAELLELHKQEYIEGTGAISGKLPLLVNNGKVSLERGELSADAPGGIINYRGSALASDSPELTLAQQALREYHYSSMSITASYLQAGNLQLGVSITGTSPLLNTKRPINVNLNLEENIPALLRSLQIANDIQKQLLGGNSAGAFR